MPFVMKIYFLAQFLYFCQILLIVKKMLQG